MKGHDVDRFSLGAFYNWSLVLFPLRISGANLLNVFGILAMFASLAFLLRTRPVEDDQDRAALRLVGLALAASIFIHSLATFGMFRYYYFWYLSASFVYWTLVFAMWFVELAGRRAWRYSTAGALSVALAVALVCVWWLSATPNNLASTRYEAGRWIDGNLEPDAIVGSFNAGQLGFFSNRSVVNLDGLINHVTYFEDVLQSESPDALLAYLDRVGVDYIADYQFGRWSGVIESEFTTVQEFRLASGGILKIMKRNRTVAPPHSSL